jgi:hypothetical protein
MGKWSTKVAVTIKLTAILLVLTTTVSCRNVNSEASYYEGLQSELAGSKHETTETSFNEEMPSTVSSVSLTEKSPTHVTSVSSQTNPHTKDKNTLTITLWDVSNFNSEPINARIDNFKEKYPDLEVELQVHNDKYYIENFPVMLMAEDLGDLVMLPPNVKRDMLSPKYFLNLSNFIEKDSSFDPNAYFMNILTYSPFEDGLYALTTNFAFDGLFMFRNDVAVTDNQDLTYNDLVHIYLDSKASIGENTYFEENFNHADIFTYNFDNLINFKEKKSDFLNPDFMNLLEQSKQNIPVNSYSVHYSESGVKQTISIDTYKFISTLTKDKPDSMFYAIPYNLPLAFLPLEDRAYSYPQQIRSGGGHYLFKSLTQYAINKNTDKELYAWEFLKCLIDEADIDDSNISTFMESKIALIRLNDFVGLGYPVNKTMFDKLITCKCAYEYYDYLENNHKSFDRDLTMDFETYTSQVKTFINEATSKMDLNVWEYNDVYYLGQKNMIWDDLYLYLTDKQSLGNTLKNIDNRVNIWLSE